MEQQEQNKRSAHKFQERHTHPAKNWTASRIRHLSATIMSVSPRLASSPSGQRQDSLALKPRYIPSGFTCTCAGRKMHCHKLVVCGHATILEALWSFHMTNWIDTPSPPRYSSTSLGYARPRDFKAEKSNVPHQKAMSAAIRTVSSALIGFM